MVTMRLLRGYHEVVQHGYHEVTMVTMRLQHG